MHMRRWWDFMAVLEGLDHKHGGIHRLTGLTSQNSVHSGIRREKKQENHGKPPIFGSQTGCSGHFLQSLSCFFHKDSISLKICGSERWYGGFLSHVGPPKVSVLFWDSIQLLGQPPWLWKHFFVMTCCSYRWRCGGPVAKHCRWNRSWAL